MVETVTGGPDSAGVAAAAQLLHDFNVEYDEPSPPPAELAGRLAELVEDGRVVVLVGRDGREPVGVAVMRLQPSLWSRGQ